MSQCASDYSEMFEICFRVMEIQANINFSSISAGCSTFVTMAGAWVPMYAVQWTGRHVFAMFEPEVEVPYDHMVKDEKYEYHLFCIFHLLQRQVEGADKSHDLVNWSEYLACF